MKTLNQFRENFSGTLTPKSSDEKKFVDKHTVQKVADRNGNKDDVFQATKVKKVDRKKNRQGYDNPEETYESLDHSMGVGKYIDDFVHSDNEKFEGKSKKERIKMALGAYYSSKNEAYTEEELDVISEELELDEAVEVNPARFQNAHGKMPSGKGAWFFTAHRSGIDFRKHKHGVDHLLVPDTDYSKAKIHAQKWAQTMGHKLVHVSEQMSDEVVKQIQESKSNLVPLKESMLEMIKDLNASQIGTLSAVFEQLDDENQIKFIKHCETQEGINKLLDFAITKTGG